MKVTLVLCALVGLAVAVPESELTINDVQPSIVGGTTATLGQFPYQASLRNGANAHFCGGSIYNTRWVISAAHCTIGRVPANTRVVVGTLDRLTGGVHYAVEKIIDHPEYSQITRQHDISLIQTVDTISFVTGKVAAIPLNTANLNGVFDCVASGWGKTSALNPIGSVSLQFLELKTITLDDCRAGHLPLIRETISNDNICTTSPVGKGLCNGDSGGPLAANGSLIGIVSWGVPCGLNFPDVFTRVSSHVYWILSEV